jgi:PAS domain S-box-containing protein
MTVHTQETAQSAMASSNAVPAQPQSGGDRVSQVLVDKRKAHSKTMRLDILPATEELAIPPQATRQADPSRDKQLALTPALLNHLFQHAYDATLLTNLNGDILAGNLRAIEYLKCDTVAGRNILHIISGADQALLATVTRTLERERFVRLHAWCRRSTGEFFPTEIAVHMSEVDAVKLLCFFVHDITWRKETEDRLQMADVAIRATHAGIAVIDLEGVLIYANPAMNGLVGHSTGETLQGQRLSRFIEEPDVPGALLAEIRAGNFWRGRVTCVQADGGRVAAECTAVGNSNSDNDLIGAVLSFSDMTDHDRADLAERSIERNRVMMESIGSVCHHLGQPSTVLLNSVELLLRLPDSDREQRQELLELSLSAAESLGQLLRELNDLRTYRSEPYLAQSQPAGDQIIAFGQEPGETIDSSDLIQ